MGNRDGKQVMGYGDPSHSGNYPHAALEAWARRIAEWHGQRLDVFAYFNNDIGGYALENSKALRALLAEVQRGM